MSDFLHMGGYGLYVWLSYLLAAGIVVVNLWHTWRRERNTWRQLERRAKRNESKTS
jgi:heme exporter protein D